MRLPAGAYGLPALLMLAAPAPAQDSPRMTEPALAGETFSRNRASILFERNRDSFQWTGRIGVDTSASGTHFGFRNLYTTNIILLPASSSIPEQRIQSAQNTLGLKLRRPVRPDLDVHAELMSFSYTDEKDVGLSSTTSSTVSGGFEVLPFHFLAVNPMVGYRWDTQASVRDRGLHYALSGRTLGLATGGYQMKAEGAWQEDLLDPRHLTDQSLRASIDGEFGDGTRDSLLAGFSRNRREFYVLADSMPAVDSRTETVWSVGNILDYAPGGDFLGSLLVRVGGRSWDRDSRFLGGHVPERSIFGSAIDEFRLDAAAQTSWVPAAGGPTGSLRLAYGERTERHAAVRGSSRVPGEDALFEERERQEKTKNNDSRRTVLSGWIDAPLSGSDTIRVSGSAGILRYDTPSRENTEDRDEQLLVLSLTTGHRISNALHIALRLEGTMSHAVYLLGERSSNNNRNRILRFSPRATVRPSRSFISVNTFEVLANYTVYDYEEQAAQVRSFSYRQFSVVDSTSLDLTRSLGLDFQGYLKLYERGQLNWGEFTERPENSFRDILLFLQARFSPSRGTTLAAGYRLFSQARYSYGAGNKILDTVIESVGPTCSIIWRAVQRGEVVLTGWYEQWSQTGGAERALANLSLAIHVNL